MFPFSILFPTPVSFLDLAGATNTNLPACQVTTAPDSTSGTAMMPHSAALPGVLTWTPWIRETLPLMPRATSVNSPKTKLGLSILRFACVLSSTTTGTIDDSGGLMGRFTNVLCRGASLSLPPEKPGQLTVWAFDDSFQARRKCMHVLSWLCVHL